MPDVAHQWRSKVAGAFAKARDTLSRPLDALHALHALCKAIHRCAIRCLCRVHVGGPPDSVAPLFASSCSLPKCGANRLKFLRRRLEFDITRCPYCGGRLRVIADVTDPAVIRKILDHVQQRAPPARRSVPEQYAI
jgi:hypothetical protein